MMSNETSISRGQRNINWIEKNLNFPDGPKAGKKFLLADFQKQWIYQIYDNAVPVTEAILSIPRKNSKTTFVSALCFLHLLGPESIPNSQLYSCAQDRKQAAITFDIMLKMIRMSPRLGEAARPVKSQKEIYCDKRGTRFRANSKDSASQYGTNPSFVIFDEIGQTKGPNDMQYEAMATGLGVQKKPLFLLISTQAARDGDFLSIKIDSFQNHPSPDQVLILHQCPEDHPDPFSEDALRQANPAYDVFMNKEFMLKWADQAKRIPSVESGYRNYALNQRVEVDTPFITKNIWKDNAGDIEDLAGKDVYIGVDLSRRNDLTGIVCMYKNSDESYSLKPFAYLPEIGLKYKSEQDRTPWDVWVKEGFIKATPGNIVDYKFAAEEIKRIDTIANIVKMAVDPYNINYFKQALLEVGFNDEWMELHCFEFKQHSSTYSPGIEELEGLFANKLIKHGEHPVLRECFQNVKVIEYSDNKRMFAKVAPNRKKDLADCAAMAAAMLKNYKVNNSKVVKKSSYAVIVI